MTTDGDPRAAQHAPEEQALLEQIDEDIQWPDGPVPMLPVAQLYVRDIPLLRPPGQSGADVLQVLWCPFDHPPESYMPRTALSWRSTADVTDILTSPPEPPVVELDVYVPEPCVLAPEQVTEYPNPMELSTELREQLGDWSRWQAAGSGVDDAYTSHPESFYDSHLSVSPGWKVGGWPQWGYTDPVPRLCQACGTEMDPLLTRGPDRQRLQAAALHLSGGAAPSPHRADAVAGRIAQVGPRQLSGPRSDLAVVSVQDSRHGRALA
ncbi:hypothetical protein ACWD11_23780 [Streptomyces sp. NPDC002776]